jgi:hypothetical protein
MVNKLRCLLTWSSNPRSWEAYSGDLDTCIDVFLILMHPSHHFDCFPFLLIAFIPFPLHSSLAFSETKHIF